MQGPVRNDCDVYGELRQHGGLQQCAEHILGFLKSHVLLGKSSRNSQYTSPFTHPPPLVSVASFAYRRSAHNTVPSGAIFCDTWSKVTASRLPGPCEFRLPRTAVTGTRRPGRSSAVNVCHADQPPRRRNPVGRGVLRELETVAKLCPTFGGLVLQTAVPTAQWRSSGCALLETGDGAKERHGQGWRRLWRRRRCLVRRVAGDMDHAERKAGWVG